MKIPELLVDIDSIPQEGLEFPLDLEAPRMRALAAAEGQMAPTVISPLRGRLKLDRRGSRLLLKGSFEVTVEIPCDRCLSEARAVLSGQVDEMLELQLPENKSRLEGEESDGSLMVMDGKVNLSGLMAEFFWLAWPYRFICAEDCAGLCSRCGADLNKGPCGCQERDWN